MHSFKGHHVILMCVIPEAILPTTPYILLNKQKLYRTKMNNLSRRGPARVKKETRVRTGKQMGVKNKNVQLQCGMYQ